MFEIIRKYTRNYPFSVICLLIVWFLSLCPFFPDTPLNDIPFIDKWTHFIMYGGTCLVIWLEYWRQHPHPNYGRLLLWAWLMPIVMSGVLELLQEYATFTRRGEWSDLLANATGVTIGAVIGILPVVFFPRR